MLTEEFLEQSNWYAIQTKPHREDQAASNIGRLGLAVLLPKVKRERLEYGNRAVSIKPLFPGYLFARFSPSSHLRSIRYARGVNRVVCFGELPVPLSEEVVDTIKARVGRDGFVNLNSSKSFRKGDQVVVNEGPLQGLAGVFEQELSDGERAVVLLKTVEYQARVLVEKLRLSAPSQLH